MKAYNNYNAFFKHCPRQCHFQGQRIWAVRFKLYRSRMNPEGQVNDSEEHHLHLFKRSLPGRTVWHWQTVTPLCSARDLFCSRYTAPSSAHGLTRFDLFGITASMSLSMQTCRYGSPLNALTPIYSSMTGTASRFCGTCVGAPS